MTARETTTEMWRLAPVRVAWNLLMAFAVYQIARLAYYAENASYLTYTADVFRGGLLFDTSAILYTNVLYVALALFPLQPSDSRAYRAVCRWLFVVVNTTALAVNLADAVYFQYTMRRTTTTVFSEFAHENNLAAIIATECASHWYFVLLAVAVAAALWKGYADAGRCDSGKRRLLYLASLAVFAPLCIAGMRGGFTTAVRPITISNAHGYALRPVDAALVLNTPFSLIRTIGKNVFTVTKYYGDEELAAIYSPVHNARRAATPCDTAVRKNVVVIIIESFGREYIGALNRDLEGGSYAGYTPFTDSLIAHSTTFAHSYCNGRKSIDGMPSILSGIPMFVEPFILTPASMNDFTGMAGLLAAEGYHTAFFHGAENGSMGFQAFARKTGFERYYGRTEYEAARGSGDFDGTWAIWDEPFLQYFADEMTKMQEPFMTAVFTASSHHPFVVPEAYRATLKEGPLPIHKCIRYTDHALRRFFDSARRQPWFANTIFVITSDHTNMSDHAEYQSDIGGFAAPIIIYDPSKPVGEVQDKVAQQTDILPTVMGMLGYGKPFIAFGIDVLKAPADSTWAVNYLGGIYQYVRYGHVLQYGGDGTRAVYSLDDRLMRHNLAGRCSVQPLMERELKAIIQQYMQRMNNDQLTVKER